MTAEDLRGRLAELLTPGAAAWLADAEASVRSDSTQIRGLFPAAARVCGRGPLGPGWTVDEAVRALLLVSLPLAGEELAGEVWELYRYGDAAERRAVLRTLSLLDIGDRGLPVVRDALRTNDTRLVAAAVGPYGATHLDPDSYRHGLLKCVFLGVPLSRAHGLAQRTDSELRRMFADYADELRAAGRRVPDDVWLVLDHDREA